MTARDPLKAFSNSRITPTMLRVAECFSRGLNTRETAFELSIKDETVKAYVQVLARLMDIPRGRDLRVTVAVAYIEASRNELFKIGSQMLRSLP